jgi:hypothetical protein
MPRIQQPEQLGSGLKLAVTGVLILGGVAAAWSYWGHHFWTALDGPTEVPLADIAKLNDPSDLPSMWVKVKFDRGFHSNVVLEEVRNGVSSIDEEYILFQAGDRWMIAGVPPGFKGNEVSGQIWRNDAPLAREIVTAVSDEFKQVHQGKLFPFEFDAGDDYGTNWKCFAGVMALFGLFGVIMGFAGVGGVIQSFRPGPELFESAGAARYGAQSASSSPEVDEVMARILRESRR